MKAESREKRRDEILDVAVSLLAERGYRDSSMIEIAKRASASKETLYAWFGDKRGLFEAVVRRNAAGVQAALAEPLDEDAATEAVLVSFGGALLELLLGDSAVAINRAAIAEAPSDLSLATLLAREGRDATLPAFLAFLDSRASRGELAIGDTAAAAGDFLGLLLADRQVRRLLGLTKAPSKAAVRKQARHAARAFLRLYAA